MGAQGTVDAIIPKTTAVVPHEQRGVATATPVDINTLFLVLRRKKRAMASWSIYSFRAALIKMLSTSRNQLCENVSITLLNVYDRRDMISIRTYHRIDFSFRFYIEDRLCYFLKKFTNKFSLFVKGQTEIHH